MDSCIYGLYALLFISLALNAMLYARVRTLSKQLSEVHQRVELTEEELSQIRYRIEKLKKGI